MAELVPCQACGGSGYTVNPDVCLNCPAPIGAYKRQDAKFCSGRCRAAYSRSKGKVLQISAQGVTQGGLK